PLPPDKEITFYDPRVASTFPARPDFPAPNQPRGMNLRDVWTAFTGIPDAILGERGPLMRASRALNRGIDAMLDPTAATPLPQALAPVPYTIDPNGDVVWDPFHVLDHNKDQSRYPGFPPVSSGIPAARSFASAPRAIPTPPSLLGESPPPL